ADVLCQRDDAAHAAEHRVHAFEVHRARRHAFRGVERQRRAGCADLREQVVEGDGIAPGFTLDDADDAAHGYSFSRCTAAATSSGVSIAVRTRSPVVVRSSTIT